MKEKIVELWHTGMLLEDIAKAVPCSRALVVYYCMKMGLKRRDAGLLSNWNEEQVNILKELWGKGHSGSQIGAVINKSRSAVIAKAHRLKLEPIKVSPSGRRSKDDKNRKRRTHGFIFGRAFRREEDRVIVQKHPVATSLNIGFMHLANSHCHEVTGRGEDGLAMYCGQPVIEKEVIRNGEVQKVLGSFCIYHAARNYRGLGSSLSSLC